MTSVYLKPGEQKRALRLRLTSSDKHRMDIIASRYEGALGVRPSASIIFAMALDALANQVGRQGNLPQHPSLRVARDRSRDFYGA